MWPHLAQGFSVTWDMPMALAALGGCSRVGCTSIHKGEADILLSAAGFKSDEKANEELHNALVASILRQISCATHEVAKSNDADH